MLRCSSGCFGRGRVLVPSAPGCSGHLNRHNTPFTSRIHPSPNNPGTSALDIPCTPFLFSVSLGAPWPPRRPPPSPHPNRRPTPTPTRPRPNPNAAPTAIHGHNLTLSWSPFSTSCATIPAITRSLVPTSTTCPTPAASIAPQNRPPPDHARPARDSRPLALLVAPGPSLLRRFPGPAASATPRGLGCAIGRQRHRSFASTVPQAVFAEHPIMSPCANTLRASRFVRCDPQEEVLQGPNLDESGRVTWAGEALIEHTSTHWGCVIGDRSGPVDARPDRGNEADRYLLVSELLACACLMRLQINKARWGRHGFGGWELQAGNGLVKVGGVCVAAPSLVFGIADPEPCARVRLSASRTPPSGWCRPRTTPQHQHRLSCSLSKGHTRSLPAPMLPVRWRRPGPFCGGFSTPTDRLMR